MKKPGRFLFIFTICLIVSLPVLSQDGSGQSLVGETMRSSGRIYVVVAVMLTILAGLIVYLARLDRKIGKLEKEMKQGHD